MGGMNNKKRYYPFKTKRKNKIINKKKKSYVFYDDPRYLKFNLKQLPRQLHNKLYIYSMRLFWRNYIPLTAKVPSWYHLHVRQQKLLFDAKDNNIHFLHLPCNTLEENKKYIVGCKCNYCSNLYLDEGEATHRINENIKQLEDDDYYDSIMPYTNISSRCNWTSRYEFITRYDHEEDDYDVMFAMKIFEPNECYRDTGKRKIINSGPIEFSLETQLQYS